MPLKKACFWKSTMPLRPIRREGSHSNERMRSWGNSKANRVSGEEGKVQKVVSLEAEHHTSASGEILTSSGKESELVWSMILA